MNMQTKMNKIMRVIAAETNILYLQKHTQEAFMILDSFKLISLTIFFFHIIAFIPCYVYFIYRLIQIVKNKPVKTIIKKDNNFAEKTIQKFDNGSFRLGSLTYVASECTLYLDDEKIRTPRREYLLLNMFLNSPHMYLTREEIAARFWSPKVDSNDKLNVSIGRLRMLLRTEPNLEIVLDRGKGYQLILKNSIPSNQEQVDSDQSTLPKNSSTV